MPGLEKVENAERGASRGRSRAPAGARPRGLADLVGGAVVVADPHSGEILALSSGAERLLGFDSGEAIGQPIAAILPALTGTPQWAAIGAAGSRDALGPALELTAITRSGGRLPMAVALSTLRCEVRGAARALAILTDVTAARRAVDALDMRNRELLALARISRIALERERFEAACQDIVGEIRVTTGFAAVAIEQYDEPRQMMVLTAATGLPGVGDGTGCEVPVDQSVSGRAVRSAQPTVEIRPAGDHATDVLPELGARTFICIPMCVRGRVIGALSVSHVSSVPCADDLVPWLQAVANIVATLVERTRVDAEREQVSADHTSSRAAGASSQARDDFLKIAAHELKTPVTVLSAYVQLLARRFEREEPEPHQVRGSFAILTEQTTRLARLANQLLDISRLEAGKISIDRQACDLAALVRRAMTATQTLTDRHALRLKAPAQVPAVVDPVRIEQVLTNLLNNAVRYSPDGGPIEVELGERSDDTIFVAVRDHGVGISPQHRARVFDRLFQAQSGSAGGLGLGLYLSQQILQQHGGSLEIDSPPDGGTRVTLSVPRGTRD